MTQGNLNELSYFTTPLPDDIARAKEHGDIALTRKLIQKRLASATISQTLKLRLTAELEVLAILDANEYPFGEAEALKKMSQVFQNFQPEELQELILSGEVEWIYKDGAKFFQRKFVENLVKTKRSYFDRYLLEEQNSIDNERQAELDENIQIMKSAGQRKAKITMRQYLKPAVELAKAEGPFLAHLPLPKDNGCTSGFQIIKTSGTIAHVGDTKATQRTISFTSQHSEGVSFEVQHTYEIKMVYHDLFAEMNSKRQFSRQLTAQEKQKNQDHLTEQAPHILFTPFLENLLQELTDEDQSLLEKAFKIYEFITTRVNYSFVREYYTIPNVSEYCAVNQKGDCGVQALLFITLCRMAGIPAVWESGLYASEYFTGPHDWAKFYTPEFGWLYADPSFGGSAYRGDNQEKWRYYFGNLDVFRMPSNSGIQAAFTPAKQQLRADPIDNQRGELESSRRGFKFSELDWDAKVIAFEFLDE